MCQAPLLSVEQTAILLLNSVTAQKPGSHWSAAPPPAFRGDLRDAFVPSEDLVWRFPILFRRRPSQFSMLSFTETVAAHVVKRANARPNRTFENQSVYHIQNIGRLPYVHR